MMPDKTTLLGLLQTMLRIRQFEHRLAKFYDYSAYASFRGRRESERTEALLTSTLYDFASSGMIGGAVHLYIGQEAVATGVCSHLRDDDYVTGSHRGHGHFLAKGGSLRGALAELMGRVDGTSHGCGGSMHLFDAERGFLGGNGIIGAQIPLALGPAFAAKYEGRDAVSVTFFGDGAVNQGTLYESMNLAALWKLPVLFVCENNLYAATTPQRISSPTVDLAPRAEGFGMPGLIVDGQDILAVYETAGEAVERARRDEGPTFIEAKTYRFHGHCGAESEHASPDECAVWLERDPIELLRRHMIEGELASEAELDEVAEVVNRELDEAEQFALASPLPEAEMLEEFVT